MSGNNENPEFTNRLLLIGRQLIALAGQNSKSGAVRGEEQLPDDAEARRAGRIAETASLSHDSASYPVIILSDSEHSERRSAFGFEDGQPYSGESSASNPVRRVARPTLPNPQRVRTMIKMRQLRGRYFGNDIFADPAWDMLLDLIAARAELRQISITSLCIASGVAPTTALRWITMMTEKGFFERREDDRDKRRAFIALSDKGATAAARYFARVENEQFGTI